MPACAGEAVRHVVVVDEHCSPVSADCRRCSAQQSDFFVHHILSYLEYNVEITKDLLTLHPWVFFLKVVSKLLSLSLSLAGHVQARATLLASGGCELRPRRHGRGGVCRRNRGCGGGGGGRGCRGGSSPSAHAPLTPFPLPSPSSAPSAVGSSAGRRRFHGEKSASQPHGAQNPCRSSRLVFVDPQAAVAADASAAQERRGAGGSRAEPSTERRRLSLTLALQRRLERGRVRRSLDGHER